MKIELVDEQELQRPANMPHELERVNIPEPGDNRDTNIVSRPISSEERQNIESDTALSEVRVDAVKAR